MQIQVHVNVAPINCLSAASPETTCELILILILILILMLILVFLDIHLCSWGFLGVAK